MEDIIKRRAGFDNLGKLYPPAPDVTIRPESIAGINGYWFTPENAEKNRLMIYVHGGAFAVGSIRSHSSMISHLAAAFNIKILFVDYALAPEHPYPQGMQDVVKVYEQLRQDYPEDRMDMAGESAGGGIIVSALAEMADRAMPLPAAAVLISPWVSLACAYPSQQENNGRDIISTEYLKSSAQDYMGNQPLEAASPELVNMESFPPTLILAGTSEILLDDSKVLHRKLHDTGRRAELILYPDQKHNWPLANIHSEASQKLLTDIKAFLKSQI